VDVTAFIPRAVRRRAAGPVGQWRGHRIRRRLEALAASGRPIVAGPWLGEVGFEILYWAPFLRWFAHEYGVPAARLTVLSRGGTASWYGEFAGAYRDVFDYVTPEVFRAWHAERVREIGEQKQTRVTADERQLLARVRDELPGGAEVLHPSVMYELLNPFWWRHLDERWVHRHTRYRRLDPPPRAVGLDLPDRYVAAKFYFNDCFPATEENRAFVRALLGRLALNLPVVSLSAGVTLDDHGTCAVATQGVRDLGGAVAPAENLSIQTAVVAHATAFVGTYGGFAYLAPFFGVPSASYYGDADGFARSHLGMARSAFAAIGTADLLHVHSTAEGPAPATELT
jgi:hypothetical protein